MQGQVSRDICARDGRPICPTPYQLFLGIRKRKPVEDQNKFQGKFIKNARLTLYRLVGCGRTN